MVRHRFLVAVFGGSNPPAPASKMDKVMSDFFNKYTSVYNVFLDNWNYQSQYVLFLEKLMYEETILPVYIKEMIFAYVSELNGCTYCKNIHKEISKKMIIDMEESSPLKNISLSSIQEEYKSVLTFSHKVNEDIDSITQEDVDAILINGFSENVISEIIAICSAAQYMNTTVRAHKISALNEAMNSASVRMMIQKGYQGLAEYLIEKRKK